VGNVKPDQATANLPVPSKNRLHYLFDDFEGAISGDGTLSYNWATATMQADGDIGYVDGDGGLLKVITGSLTTHENDVYMATETFTLEAGKRMWFGIRYKVSVEVNETAFFFGLQQLTATAGAAISTTSAERIGFKTDSGDDDVDFTIGSGGTAVASASAIDTFFDCTFSSLEF
jgi:hypothetical protein